jgi:ubiquitin carboxyl-terminal hydrolase 10
LPAHGDTTPIAKTKSTKAIIPAIPKSLPKEASPRPSSAKSEEAQQSPAIIVAEVEAEPSPPTSEEAVLEEVKAPVRNAWSKPKVWSTVLAPGAKPAQPASNGSLSAGSSTVGKTNAEVLTEALKSFDAISNDSKVTFLEPRGLANAGNMCYMNSVSFPSSNHVNILI